MRHPDHKDDVILPGQAENIMGCTPVRVARGSSRDLFVNSSDISVEATKSVR